jgi:hypothetical protein
MFISAGALIIMVQVVSYLYPRLRQLEEELPDAAAAVAVEGG